MTLTDSRVRAWRRRLKCSVRRVDDLFDDCLREADAVMSNAGVGAWIDGASHICGMGRGQELVLIFLEGMPEVVRHTDETVIEDVVAMAQTLSKRACGPAINPFLAGLPHVARRLADANLLRHYLQLVDMVAAETADGVKALLERTPMLLDLLSVGGLESWIEQGLRAYKAFPWRYQEFFGLQTADSHAMLQRERNGTLYIDNERHLRLWLKALWGQEPEMRPYSLAYDQLRRPVPYHDKLGFHIPDVYDDLDGVSGLERYHATLAHLAAHREFSQPYLADNFSSFQHLAVETFEDCRVERLAIGRYPGLRRLWLALHPVPEQGACPEGWSCIRHRLTMLSRALLDPDHPYTDPHVQEFSDRFEARFAEDPHNPNISAELGVQWLTRTYEHDYRNPQIWFEDTFVDYRDDNRYLWMFLEDVDDEDEFHSDHGHDAPPPDDDEDGDGLLPPQHYPEWDYQARHYRPDWSTVYEALPTPGDAGHIDRLLDRHRMLAKRLKRVVDLLKPHQRKRIRFQQEGDEVDLDVLIRAMTDYRSGAEPEQRIHVRHETSGRSIALLLLLDLSESIKEVPEGGEHSILQVSQEAVSLLGWTVDALGDRFAVAGFASNTRHQVNYTHFKSFNEPWGDGPKARLAAMDAGLSTRMGAALRHAGRYLKDRREEKKILMVLSDGEPHDIDVPDPEYLKADTHAAVGELKRDGVDTYCITLDPQADAYVADLFGPARYTVVDRVESLPGRLSELFMALTR